MKPKKQKKKIWPWVLVIGIILTLFGFIMYVHYDNYRTQQKINYEEDIKFAKIESYVDLVKARLDREIPEGRWEIIKECRAPHTKGSFDTYRCTDYVTSDSTGDFKTRLDEIVGQLSTQIDEGSITETAYTFKAAVDKPELTCIAIYSRDNGQGESGVSCDERSHRIRYTLVD